MDKETTPLIVHRLIRGQDSSSTRSLWNRRRIYMSILVTEILERMTYYGLTANLALYLQMQEALNVRNFSAIIICNAFNGFKFFMCFFGGWLADIYLGRYMAIIIGLIIYFLGIVLFPIASLPSKISNLPAGYPSGALIILGLFFVSIGCGFVKSNLPPFGAEQVKRSQHTMMRNDVAVQTFFNWFYWSINLGSLFAYLFIAWMQQTLQRYFISYVILSSCMLLAIVVFLSSHGIYHLQHRPSNRVCQTILLISRRCCCCGITSCQQCCCKKSHRDDNDSGNRHDDGWDQAHATHTSGPVNYEFQSASAHLNRNDVNKVELRSITKIAVVFVALLPFWAAYSQMQSTYLLQAVHMKLYTPNKSNGFVIPVAWLSLCDIVVILIILPVLDRLIYPYFQKKGRPIGISVRFVLGMMFAFISVLWAAELQVACTYYGQSPQTVGNQTFLAYDLWFYWQIPQYIFIGFSEMLASVTAMKFAYSRAPPHLQGTVMGFFDLMTGVGYFLGLIILAVVRDASIGRQDHDHVVLNNLRNVHLRVYFLVLAAVIFATIIIFIIFDKKYQIDVADSVVNKLGQDSCRSEIVVDGNRSNNKDCSHS